MLSSATCRLKQAVNFAIDRTALVEQRGAYCGLDSTISTSRAPCPGFRNAKIYPSRPNLAKARALAAGNTRGGRGVFYSCNTGPCIPIAQIIQANLREIGVDMDLRPFPRCIGCDRKTSIRGEPFDMSMELWSVDYFDPQDFMFLLDGRTIRPKDNTNLSYFDSSEYNQTVRCRLRR